MGEPSSKRLWLQFLKAVRVVILIPILIYVALATLAVYVAITALQSNCSAVVVTFVISLAVTTSVRVIWLIVNGCIQAGTASVMNEVTDGIKSTVTDRRVSIPTFASSILRGTIIYLSVVPMLRISSIQKFNRCLKGVSLGCVHIYFEWPSFLNLRLCGIFRVSRLTFSLLFIHFRYTLQATAKFGNRFFMFGLCLTRVGGSFKYGI